MQPPPSSPVTPFAVMRAVRQSKLSTPDKTILLVLASLMDPATGVIPDRFQPSLADLASMTSLGRSTVARRVPALVEAGWLAVSTPTKRAAWKDKETNRYALLIPVMTGLRLGLVPDGDQSQSGTSPAAGLGVVPERDLTSPAAGHELLNLRTNEPTPTSAMPTEEDELEPEPREAGKPQPNALPIGDTTPASLPTRGDGFDNFDLSTVDPSLINQRPPATAEAATGQSRTSDRWTTNTESMPTTPTAAAQPGRQGGLFSTRLVKLSEREEIALAWLRGRPDEYPNATEADARAVAKLFQQQYPGKPLGYMRAVAERDGGGFGHFIQRVRDQRSKDVEKQIKELEKVEPACEHGTLAGRAPHPTHGTPLCAACRRGLPATTAEATTHPVVAAVLRVYGAVYNDTHRLKLIAPELVEAAQEIEALHAAGASPDQLTELAHAAGTRGITLVEAAKGR